MLQLSRSCRWPHAVLVLLVVSLMACQASENRPVITVDGVSISEAEYRAELERVRGAADESTIPGEVMRALKANLLNELIEQQLVLQQADRYGVTLGDDEVQARLDEYRSDYPEGAFESTLRDHGVQLDSFREQIRRRLLMEKVIEQVVAQGIEPDEEEVESYYRGRVKEFAQREKIRLHQIVVQTREEAEAIRSRIAKGEDFADLARRHSLTPDAVDGGDLGNVAREEVPVEFGRAFSLEVEQLSPVVSSPYGFHIFYVSEHVPARVRSFDEVSDIVRDRMLSSRKEAAYQLWLANLRKDTEIRVNQDIVDEIR